MILNYYVLLIFAPILVLVGILGFLVPQNKSLTSGAPAYNIFHIVFGLIGLMIVLAGSTNGVRAFNIAFGLIDLYQAAASFFHWLPERHFRWTRVDDALHIAVGTILVLVGILG